MTLDASETSTIWMKRGMETPLTTLGRAAWLMPRGRRGFSQIRFPPANHDHDHLPSLSLGCRPGHSTLFPSRQHSNVLQSSHPSPSSTLRHPLPVSLNPALLSTQPVLLNACLPEKSTHSTRRPELTQDERKEAPKQVVWRDQGFG